MQVFRTAGRVALAAFSLMAGVARAQAPLVQWHHLDPAADKKMGISTARAYALLQQLNLRPASPVVVAVIDGGIDTTHADLKAVLWRNPGEVPGNGQDDDHNGYADDVRGWNFMGGTDGRSAFRYPKEETRLYARLRPLYEGQTAATVPPDRQAEFRLYEQARQEYTTQRAKAEADYQSDTEELDQFRKYQDALKKAFGVTVLDSALLLDPPTNNPNAAKLATAFYRMLRGRWPNTDSASAHFQRYNARLRSRLDYAYNLAYVPEPLAGEHPADLTERFYGNADLQPRLHDHSTEHGTHCAGIIGADRANGVGVQGVADAVRILSVRCVPDGDERDKDVANAIRYAVDNGAKVVSMSFGKYISPDKALIDDAMRYADAHGVLLVHAAGNDNTDLDTRPHYPNDRYLDGQLIPNLITVGASGPAKDKTLPALFSNYGRESVDVFAPGVDILSTMPGSTYQPQSGTSMATPVVAGMAAVLKAYFPNLTPADLKRLIMASAAPLHTKVLRPGSKDEKVDFATLSRTGGVVNLYEAVRLASEATSTDRAKAGAAGGKKKGKS